MDALKQKAKDMVTTLGGVALVAGAVGAYLFRPAGVAAGAMMNAPGAARFFISHAAFLANPQLYFHILRTAGGNAAAAAFAL